MTIVQTLNASCLSPLQIGSRGGLDLLLHLAEAVRTALVAARISGRRA
jgi:hypothetical protein